MLSDLSSTTFQKSRDDYSTNLNKANQLRIIFIIDSSRTKSSINPRITTIRQFDHVSTHSFMDKEHILLGNQCCAHQLSLLRNIQQRASSDKTKSANEPTIKDKYVSFFLVGIATHKLLVNKISSSKGKQLWFYHASCSFTMTNHYHNN